MADDKNVEQSAGRDAWFVDKSIKIELPSEMGRDQLLKILEDNRANLESLKHDYRQAKLDSAPKRKIEMLWHEMMRVVSAIEVIKNRLVLTGGAKVPFSDLDIEHPDDACARLTPSWACFPAGTLIRTPSGAIDIAAAKAGDLVLAFDPVKHILRPQRILRVDRTRHAGIWEIDFDDGTKLRTTGHHSFLVGGKWQQADAVIKGDVLATVDAAGSVRPRRVLRCGPTATVEEVFNLVVEGDFTFVADGVVAHSFTHFRALRMFGWLVYAALRRVISVR
ncbi:MAG: hypothetical protein HYR84_01540 [Planctomycetes bacterium]|nr:hypothetical protein [Planctomycetota bacterium]